MPKRAKGKKAPPFIKAKNKGIAAMRSEKSGDEAMLKKKKMPA